MLQYSLHSAVGRAQAKYRFIGLVIGFGPAVGEAGLIVLGTGGMVTLRGRQGWAPWFVEEAPLVALDSIRQGNH